MITYSLVENKWDKAHFFIYLYIFIAKDNNLTNEEVKSLLYNKILPVTRHYTASQTMAAITSVIDEMQNHSIQDSEEIIANYCTAFISNEEEIESLLNDLDDIMEADGKVNDLELCKYRKIKKILSNALYTQDQSYNSRRAS